MPLEAQMYCAEQIYIQAFHTHQLKMLEKALLRTFNSGNAPAANRRELIAFCRDWFHAHEQDRLDRIAREEAWRREWSGKKGQVKALFDRIDEDGSGSIDFDELQSALQQLPDFFGYTTDGGGGGEGGEGATSGTPKGMQEWMEDEVSGNGVMALFKRLDLDGDGRIDWEEFWKVIGEWLESGFNRLEELRQKEQQLKEERDRIAAEEEAKRKAAEEAAAEAARLEAERKEAEERRRKELANMSAAEREKAEKEAAEVAKKEAARKEREKIEAAKAEEARLKAEQDAKAAAEEAERLKASRADREAKEGAERLAREKAEAEAAAKAAADAEAAAMADADRARWAAAVQHMEEFAAGVMSEKPVPEDALEKISKVALTALAEGEPGLGEAGAVIGYSDVKGELIVMATTDDGKTPGSVTAGMREPFAGDAESVGATTHSMIAGGKPLMDVDGVTYGVLQDSTGYRIGALVSGGDHGRPPAVPAAFVNMMAVALGPLLDKAWRLLKLSDLVDVTKYWIESLCEGVLDKLEYLSGGEPYSGSDYALHLSDKNGHVGSFVVVVKPGSELNSFMKEMLDVTGEMLEQAGDDLDEIKMGDGDPDWLPDGMKGLKGLRGGHMAARMALPNKMMKYARKLLSSMPLKDLIGEIKSYNNPPEVVSRVMQGVVLLVARVKVLKDIPDWKDVRKEVNDALVKECVDFDASLKGHKRQWVECRKANKSLTSEEVSKRGSKAVQVFQKWVEVCRLVRQIAQQVRKEAAAAEGDDDMETGGGDEEE